MGAPFGDLEVRERLSGEAKGGHLRLDPVLGNAAPFVNARKRTLQFGISLRIAPRDDDLAVATQLLELDGPQYLGLRLLARRRDERAGVDDHDVGAVWIGGERPALIEEIAGHDLQVDCVLGAAERYECKRSSLLFHRRRLYQTLRISAASKRSVCHGKAPSAASASPARKSEPQISTSTASHLGTDPVILGTDPNFSNAN